MIPICRSINCLGVVASREAGLISVIASNARAEERSASLSPAVDILTQRFSVRQVRSWTIDSPRRVIDSGSS